MKRWQGFMGSLGVLLASSLVLPQPVRAETREYSVTVSSQGISNFTNLVQQAEGVVGSLIQRTFGENPGITEVLIAVVGDRNGQVVPLLSVRVSRSNWEAQPDLQAWTRYYRSAEILLGFVNSPAIATAPQVPSFDPVAASMTDREANFYQ